MTFRATYGHLLVRLAACLFAVCLVTGLCLPGAALAQNSAFDDAEDAFSFHGELTGNVFSVNKPLDNQSVETDLYWFGESLDASNLKVGTGGSGSAVLAGDKLSLTKTDVAGSLRMAGELLSIDATNVTNNITAAGRSINVSGTKARGLYLAAESVTVDGTFAAGSIAAEEVTVKGSFKGDLHLSAKTITIEKGAVIEGSLIVPEGIEPTIAEGATVGEVVEDEVPLPTMEETSADIYVWLGMLVFACLSHIVLCLFFMALLKRPLAVCAEVAAKRSLPVCLSGVGAVVAGPVLLIALCIPIITIPLAALFGAGMALLWAFGIPLVGAVAGLVVADFLNSRFTYLFAVLATVVLTMLTYAPFLFPIIPTCCAAYLTGCLIQLWWLRRKAAGMAE